jgi:hypothetical protein
MALRAIGGGGGGVVSALVGRLLGGVGGWLGGGVIKAEIGLCEPHLEPIGAAGELEGARLRGEASAWRQQGGAGGRGEGRVDKGILHGPGHGLRGLALTEGAAFAAVMRGIEAPLFECEVIRLGPWRAREKSHEALVLAGFLALLAPRLRGIGVFHVLAPLVAAGMAGNERVVALDAEPVRRRFAREGGASLRGGDGIVVGVEGNAPWPGGADLRHRGDGAGRPRQRAQAWAFGGP